MYYNIYGCGFAGLISSLGLCNNGFIVNAVDINRDKVTNLNSKMFASSSDEINDAFKTHIHNNLFFYQNGDEPNSPQASLVTVPTPFQGDQLTLDFVISCLDHILTHIKVDVPKIIIRSTLPLGGMKLIAEHIASQGQNAELFYVPEFMREGTGLSDWNDPPLSIVGLQEGSECPEFLHELFKHTNLSACTYQEAITVKLASNAFHALKVSFANEVHRICSDQGTSSKRVMELFCEDTKLNVSEKYLRPGFAWGGSCLGKDTKSLSQQRKDLPLMHAIIDSNNKHIDYYKNKILESRVSEVTFSDLSFKPNVEDFRESPVIDLIKKIMDDDQIKQINILDNKVDFYEHALIHEKINVKSFKSNEESKKSNYEFFHFQEEVQKL